MISTCNFTVTFSNTVADGYLWLCVACVETENKHLSSRHKHPGFEVHVIASMIFFSLRNAKTNQRV